MAARLLELYAAKPAGQSSLYAAAAETLRDVRAAGVACGLCTNKPDAMTRELLQALGVTEAFGCIQGNTAGRILRAFTASWRVSIRSPPLPSWSATVLPTCAGLAAIVLVSYGYTATPAHALGADAVNRHTPRASRHPCLARWATDVILSIYQMFVIAGLGPAIWWPSPIFVFTGFPLLPAMTAGKGRK